MRPEADAASIGRFLDALGKQAKGSGVVYLVGGTSAVWLGWRASTVDIDLKLDPEPAGVFEAIAKLKDQLGVNVELASPDQFIPAVPGWQSRSEWVGDYGPLQVRHFDFTQALAKIERGHARDLDDVRSMWRASKIGAEALLQGFAAIQSQLIRYPGIDARRFERRVLSFCEEFGESESK